MTDRIAQLEAENAMLKARLRASGLMPPPAVLPTDAELDKLMRMVEGACPQLKPTVEEPNHRQQFANALHYLAFAFRTDALNSTYAISFFIDEANEWMRRF